MQPLDGKAHEGPEGLLRNKAGKSCAEPGLVIVSRRLPAAIKAWVAQCSVPHGLQGMATNGNHTNKHTSTNKPRNPQTTRPTEPKSKNNPTLSQPNKLHKKQAQTRPNPNPKTPCQPNEPNKPDQQNERTSQTKQLKQAKQTKNKQTSKQANKRSEHSMQEKLNLACCRDTSHRGPHHLLLSSSALHSANQSMLELSSPRACLNCPTKTLNCTLLPGRLA